MYNCDTSRSCDILLIYTFNFIKDFIKTSPDFSMLKVKLWLQGWVLSFILENVLLYVEYEWLFCSCSVT